MTRAEINEIVEVYISIQPDEPLYIQYIDYMSSILIGNLGTSTSSNQPVMEIIADAMPWTIFISVVSLALLYLIGIGLGALMAYKEGSKFDMLNTGLGVVFSSVPFYIVAALLLWFLSFEWGLFPTQGRVGRSVESGSLGFYISAVYHAILPITSLVLTGYGLLALSMRGNSIRVLGEDYLRVARLRALPERRIAFRYVARNAVLPLYTSMMVSMGTLFGGSVILEEIFMYPGMGWYMFRAVVNRDYPLLMGSFLFITIGIILGIYLADLTYGWIDPRASGENRSESYGGVSRSLSLSAILGSIRNYFQTDEYENDDRDITELSDEIEDSPFDTMAEAQLSRKERFIEIFNEVFVASFRILWGDIRARVGLIIILFYILVGTVGIHIVDTTSTFGSEPLIGAFQMWEHPLGTDYSGRDIFSQLVHATPAMLKMMGSGALFSIAMATIWGTFSGFVGGKTDRIMMTIADILMTIPGLPLVIVLAVTFEPRDPYLVGIILTINAWAGLARSLRSQVLTIRQESYVEASRAMGIHTRRILHKNVIPELMPLVMVNFVMQARHVIFTSVGLYFLGILPFSTLNWGVILNFAYNSPTGMYTWQTAHWFLSPMMTILLFTLGLILFGQGCDRLFNPRIRARHEETSEEPRQNETDREVSVPY